MEQLEKVQQRATKITEELEILSDVISLRELGWLMAKKAQGNLINLYKSLEGACREDRAWLFPQTRGDGRKLNTGGTHFNNFETD